MISILKKPNVLLAPLVVTLWVLLTSSPTASAFYDPSLQRWINRDPIGELGFQVCLSGRFVNRPVYWLRQHASGYFDLYSFVGNRLPNASDAFGLSETTRPASDIALGYLCATICAPIADFVELTVGHPLAAMLAYQACSDACFSFFKDPRGRCPDNGRPVIYRNAPPPVIEIPIPRSPQPSLEGGSLPPSVQGG